MGLSFLEVLASTILDSAERIGKKPQLYSIYDDVAAIGDLTGEMIVESRKSKKNKNSEGRGMKHRKLIQNKIEL